MLYDVTFYVVPFSFHGVSLQRGASLQGGAPSRGGLRGQTNTSENTTFPSLWSVKILIYPESRIGNFGELRKVTVRLDIWVWTLKFTPASWFSGGSSIASFRPRQSLSCPAVTAGVFVYLPVKTTDTVKVCLHAHRHRARQSHRQSLTYVPMVADTLMGRWIRKSSCPSKKSKVPLTKAVTLTVRVNEAYGPVYFVWIVTDCLTDRLGSEHILTMKQSVSIDTMLNFDGECDDTCKKALMHEYGRYVTETLLPTERNGHKWRLALEFRPCSIYSSSWSIDCTGVLYLRSGFAWRPLVSVSPILPASTLASVRPHLQRPVVNKSQVEGSVPWWSSYTPCNSVLVE